ncbi:MAG TPA: UDP-N-acetylmuramoyl-tripeptide--D-alanyl-D-alanine ligase [Nitrospiraceae bacterium]|nr:UDP-N-acetylmuramoyl-tripeptide--D-alanyl-D-alanine ligase [Nitrospiraceae bacterium]
MSLFTVEEVIEIISAKSLLGQNPRGLQSRIRRLCTDSREVRSGDLFVALKGERFDGHEFVNAALQQGAVGAIVQERYRFAPRPEGAAEVLLEGRSRVDRGSRRAPFLLGVPDPLLAYQQLAAYHRSRFRIPVVAVTGSNGKTTTKEMVAAVLAQQWTVLKTEGNLNNRIGVPQTLFRLTARHEAAVVEMGVDQKGQTARLCEIVRPTIGLITNIGPDHLEFFGSMEASAQAKAELLNLLPSDGAVVLNADDAYFEYLASQVHCRVLSFGLTPRAQVRATEVMPDLRRGMTFRLALPGKMRRPLVVLRAHGAHNLSNALAAAAVGHLLGVSGTMIAEGLARFRPATMRSQVSLWGGVRVINDCYNANPASMKAAIELLVQLGSGGRTVAVLGDMLELGPETVALHREVGAYLARRGVSVLIVCGVLGHELAEGARAAGMASDHVIKTADAAAAAVSAKAIIRDGDVVLVKASRGMRLERVIEVLGGRRSAAKGA